MITVVETIPRRGHCVVWDGSNTAEMRLIAGKRFLGVEETFALIRNGRGSVTYLPPGWSVTAWFPPDGETGSGDPEINVCAPGAADAYTRAVDPAEHMPAALGRDLAGAGPASRTCRVAQKGRARVAGPDANGNRRRRRGP